jgi:hypothetical protein
MDLRPVVSKLRFLVKVHTAMKEPPISCLGEGVRDNEEHRIDKHLKKRIGMARRFEVPMACALRESYQPSLGNCLVHSIVVGLTPTT